MDGMRFPVFIFNHVGNELRNIFPYFIYINSRLNLIKLIKLSLKLADEQYRQIALFYEQHSINREYAGNAIYFIAIDLIKLYL